MRAMPGSGCGRARLPADPRPARPDQGVPGRAPDRRRLDPPTVRQLHQLAGGHDPPGRGVADRVGPGSILGHANRISNTCSSEGLGSVRWSTSVEQWQLQNVRAGAAETAQAPSAGDWFPCRGESVGAPPGNAGVAQKFWCLLVADPLAQRYRVHGAPGSHDRMDAGITEPRPHGRSQRGDIGHAPGRYGSSTTKPADPRGRPQTPATPVRTVFFGVCGLHVRVFTSKGTGATKAVVSGRWRSLTHAAVSTSGRGAGARRR
ncbi:hypothetical protein ABIA39_004876 [Nocardia sp. GAS34]